jgi:hypothetical protein
MRNKFSFMDLELVQLELNIKFNSYCSICYITKLNIFCISCFPKTLGQ